MKICFVSTGDIKDIATSKRALGLANPLIQLGWEVHILMEDAAENKLRVGFECSPEVQIHYFNKSGVLDEIRAKNRLIKQIHPDYVYICAFVFRNIVGIGKSHQKLVEHSELQSAIPTIKGLKKNTYLFVGILFHFLCRWFALCKSLFRKSVHPKK